MSQENINQNVVSKETICLALQNLQNGLLHIVCIFLRKPASYESAKSGVQTFGRHGTAAIFAENRQAAGEVEANIAVQVCRQKEIQHTEAIQKTERNIYKP